MDGELRRFLRNEDGRIFWQYSDGSHRGLNSLDVMLINKALEASLPSAQPSDVVEANYEPWPNPTPKMLKTPEFNAIWGVIKSWDINVPSAYVGYCGATGNHVRAILDALSTTQQAQSVLPFDEELLSGKACSMFGMIDTEQMMRTVKALRELNMSPFTANKE